MLLTTTLVLAVLSFVIARSITVLGGVLKSMLTLNEAIIDVKES